VTGVALVTGASRGIGLATAVALARAEFDVVITARTIHEGDGVDDADGRPLPGSLEATAAAVEGTGRRCLALPLDLLDHPSLAATVHTVLARWGRIDVLVNNAVHTGPGSMERFADLTAEMVETKLAANVIAPFILIQAAVPAMLEQGRGTIINISSHVATNDPPARSGEGGWGLGYALSKAAFHRMAGHLKVEYADLGLSAYNIDPGFVLTERMATRQADLGLEHRYPGAPPSVPAAAVAWLAREARGDAAALNGTTVIAQKLVIERGLHDDWRR
jgi:NAD(P)-dependent dehydrogenase (short-subunit alcohol dehydrogenase family)